MREDETDGNEDAAVVEADRDRSGELKRWGEPNDIYDRFPSASGYLRVLTHEHARLARKCEALTSTNVAYNDTIEPARKALHEAGVGHMHIPRGIKWLASERDDARARIGFLESCNVRSIDALDELADSLETYAGEYSTAADEAADAGDAVGEDVYFARAQDLREAARKLRGENGTMRREALASTNVAYNDTIEPARKALHEAGVGQETLAHAEGVKDGAHFAVSDAERERIERPAYRRGYDEGIDTSLAMVRKRDVLASLAIRGLAWAFPRYTHGRKATR